MFKVFKASKNQPLSKTGANSHCLKSKKFLKSTAYQSRKSRFIYCFFNRIPVRFMTHIEVRYPYRKAVDYRIKGYEILAKPSETMGY